VITGVNAGGNLATKSCSIRIMGEVLLHEVQDLVIGLRTTWKLCEKKRFYGGKARIVKDENETVGRGRDVQN